MKINKHNKLLHTQYYIFIIYIKYCKSKIINFILFASHFHDRVMEMTILHGLGTVLSAHSLQVAHRCEGRQNNKHMITSHSDNVEK